MDPVDDSTVDSTDNRIGNIPSFSDSFAVPPLGDLSQLDEEGIAAAAAELLSQPIHTQVHSSQGQEEVDWATFDLEEPDYLIKHGGVPNTEKIEEYQRLPEYKFDMNLEEVMEEDWRKNIPQIYSKKLNMLLVTPSDGYRKPKEVVFWTAKKVHNGRVRIVMLRKDKKDRHKKVTLCSNHQKKWPCGAKTLDSDWSYILSNSTSAQYHAQQNHPVLIVPLEQSYKDKNAKTGEDGHCYPMEFYFPCNTTDLKQDSVSLVAALEVPSQSTDGMAKYRCVGVTTFEVRVCGSPGRDKDSREENLLPSVSKKAGASRKRSTRGSTGPSEDGPPPPKQEKVAAEQLSNAGCSQSDDLVTDLLSVIGSATGNADCITPTGGMASEEDPLSSTVAPVAMEMGMHFNNGPSNADLMAAVNHLGARFSAFCDTITATVNQLQADVSAVKRSMHRLEERVSCRNEVRTAEATIGGDVHSHTEH